jgi:dolichol kinase
VSVELARVDDSHTLLRRFWHVLGGLAALAPYALDLVARPPYTLALAAILAFWLVVDLVRLRHPATNALFVRLFRRLLLPRDLVGLNGTTYYVAGVLLAVALFPRPIAVASVLFLILGDFVAGVVGRTWGRIRLFRGGKSLEGAAACFLVCLAIGMPLVGPGPSVGGALAAALVEFAGLPVDDNLLIPPVSGAVLLWLS